MASLRARAFCALLAGLTVVMAISCSGDSETRKTQQAAATASRIDSVISEDGTTIVYETAGEGQPALVFVHCWACDRTYWDDQFNAFAARYRVVRLDLAGHGESGATREDYTIELFGADVAAVANELGLDSIVLIGHSMGGAVVIEAAGRLGNKVLGLVGVDTYQYLAGNYSQEETDKFLEPFREDFAATTLPFVQGFFPDSADTDLMRWVSEDMAAAPPEVSISAMRNLFTYDAVPVLKETGVPVRAISSDKFQTRVDQNRQVTASFEVVYIPGTGHFLHMERPERFNQLLEETIQGLVNGT